MEFNIYNWLTLNESISTSFIQQPPTNIIDYILILSISGLYISKKQLNIIFDKLKSIKTNNDHTTFFGLNKNQFKKLELSFVSYENQHTKNNNNELIFNHDIIKYSNSLVSPSKILKFNCSMTIIIENNKYHLDNNSNINNNNDFIKSITVNKNNETNNNYKLFQKVWGNLIIRNEILFHLRLYNIFKGKDIEITQETINTKQQRYLNYMDTITLKDVILKVGDLPSHIENISFCRGYKGFTGQLFTPGIFSDNIKSLSFYNINFNQSLEGNWLPNKLESLVILNKSYNHPILKNQLPKSLTLLKLNDGYNCIFEKGSIPSTVKSLNYYSDSKKNEIKISNGFWIPKTTTSLQFDEYFNQPIKLDDIPHNVTSLRFGNDFNSNIQPNSLPSSLISLYFCCFYDKQLSVDILPSNLKTIEFFNYFHPLESNVFPISITSIKFSNFNQIIPKGYFYKFEYLKSLDLGYQFNQIIPIDTLPQKSLEILKLEGLTIPIPINSFPSSIIELHLNNWNEQYSSLPNLKRLYILYPSSLNQDSFSNGSLPNSLESLYISPSNSDLINLLDPHILSNKIRFTNYT